MTRIQTTSKERTTTYTTVADFCRLFKEGMDSLYGLALMLAADPGKAEELFVSGLDDCAAGSPVFKEWANAWARRTIIKNAVRLIAPKPVFANGVLNTAAPGNTTNRALPGLPAEINAVLGLRPFERFAFILSVLEGYSDLDSALLLGCTRQALVVARMRAEQGIAHFAATREGQYPGANPKNKPSAIKRPLPMQLATPA